MDNILAGQDQVVVANNLANDTTNRNWSCPIAGGPDANANEARAAAFQQYQNVFTNNAIRGAVRATYLQDLHKEIAIKRISLYLEDRAGRGAIVANTLPDRTAVAAGALNINDVNDYRQYDAFIRAAVYNENQLNAFVVEICRKINQQRALAQVQA